MGTMSEVWGRLSMITDGCRDDMHEPDNQGLSARVVGNVLDNAGGEQITTAAVTEGWQEFVVILRRNGKEECFNLCDLIALARRYKISPSDLP